MRDERKVMLLGKHTPGKPKIHIYTSSGLPITTITVSFAPPPGFQVNLLYTREHTAKARCAVGPIPATPHPLHVD